MDIITLRFRSICWRKSTKSTTTGTTFVGTLCPWIGGAVSSYVFSGLKTFPFLWFCWYHFLFGSPKAELFANFSSGTLSNKDPKWESRARLDGSGTKELNTQKPRTHCVRKTQLVSTNKTRAHTVSHLTQPAKKTQGTIVLKHKEAISFIVQTLESERCY